MYPDFFTHLHTNVLHMSLSPTELKRRTIAHSHLLSARRYLAGSDAFEFPISLVRLGEIEEKLTAETLLNGLHVLIAHGNTANPRAAFWKNLSAAADTLNQTELAEELHARFLLTVKTHTDFSGGS